MILLSNSQNPFLHLAVEEVLIEEASTFGPSLFLYVNAPSVNIGKNQNPWFECSPKFLTQNNIKLCRRCSGGGAVYHDLGNLNYSFIMPKDCYDEKKQFAVIFDALAHFDISSELDAHNSIFVSQKKFSGSAFAKKINGFMHHGTMLVNANLHTLNQALTPELATPFGRAVASRRSPVVNLNIINSELTVFALQKAIIKSFNTIFSEYAKQYFIQDLYLDTVIEQKQKFLETWNWVFNKTPR